jgi:hypothetical protein
MNEALLQLIWQHSLYNPSGLKTTDGEPISVIFPGRRNTDSGPDFLEAKIRIGKTLLVGHIEMHLGTNDWYKHGHQHDDAYKNIILHIVYNHNSDKNVANAPTLQIGPYIPQNVLSQYQHLIWAKTSVPCAKYLASVKDITKISWLGRMLAERWEQKLGDWKELLDRSAGDWRNLLYWRMAANFGFKTNATPFLLLAQSLPLNILAKHRENLLQVEALLFGQAGMLNAKFNEAYPNQLQKEYEYLQKKYKLTPIPVHLWKYLRMRPANFPSLRIAQFAALIHQSLHLFTKFIETATIKEIKPLLNVTAGGYWDKHYRLGEPQKESSDKHLGISSVHNIVINTIAPIKFLYAQNQQTADQQEIALQLLESIPAEKNKIITLWNTTGWEAENAGQSQALIQLYNNYCSSKRCLECSIGLSIIKQP